MESCQSLAERFSGGVRIKPKPAVHRGSNTLQNLGRGRVRILVGVEFEQSPNFRLLTGSVGVKAADERSDERCGRFWMRDSLRHGEITYSLNNLKTSRGCDEVFNLED